MPFAVTEVARDHLNSLWERATTALLGRINAEGFIGFWPTVIGRRAPTLATRVREVARRHRQGGPVLHPGEAPWERTTIVDKPAAEVVADLKATEGGDILVLSSASVIKPLLAADQVDRLSLMIFPVFLGGGPRLFDDGLPAGQWALVSQAAGEHGTLALVYDRVR